MKSDVLSAKNTFPKEAVNHTSISDLDLHTVVPSKLELFIVCTSALSAISAVNTIFLSTHQIDILRLHSGLPAEVAEDFLNEGGTYFLMPLSKTY